MANNSDKKLTSSDKVSVVDRNGHHADSYYPTFIEQLNNITDNDEGLQLKLKLDLSRDNDEAIDSYVKKVVNSYETAQKKSVDNIDAFKLQREQQLQQNIIQLQRKVDTAYNEKEKEKLEKQLEKARKDAKEELKELDDENSVYRQEKEDALARREKENKKLQRQQDIQFQRELIKQEQDARRRDLRQSPLFSAQWRSNLRDLWKSVDKNGDYSLDLEKVFENISNSIEKIASFAKQLDSTVQSIASRKSDVDTALQGSNRNRQLGSYWDYMADQAMSIVGYSPLVKQSDYLNNMQALVDQGISFDVEQRAFLMTISDKIAGSFKANESGLRTLIRIQQEDTTAGRLGMESALTGFLNSMYETTEYIKDSISSSVKSALQEAEALMNGTSSVAFEWQVQKWLGSLYSAGMSSSAINSIASALGGLAAGKIDSLSGGAGNLMVMAANQSGISIGDILQNGLTDRETNELLNAMVDYLQGIYEESKDSHVVQQQIANVYGLSASDLKAVANLSNPDTLSSIANTNYNYAQMIDRLYDMANTMYSRTSLAELKTNALDNFKYSLANGIANNPITYIIYTIGEMMKGGGGSGASQTLPDITFAGTGAALHTDIASLLQVAALGGSFLSGIGQIISSGSSGGFVPSAMLKALGIGGTAPTMQIRGSGTTAITVSGEQYSESGYTGNSSSSDVLSKTMTDAEQTKSEALTAAAESEENDIPNRTINQSILSIYNLLQELVEGSRSIHVVQDLSYSGFTQPSAGSGSLG